VGKPPLIVLFFIYAEKMQHAVIIGTSLCNDS